MAPESRSGQPLRAGDTQCWAVESTRSNASDSASTSRTWDSWTSRPIGGRSGPVPYNPVLMALPPAPEECTARVAELLEALAPLHDDLLTPALVIDLDAVDHNIAAMLACCGSPVRWRPHIKTIKQPRLIAGLLEQGVRALKCATLDELALALQTAEDLETSVDVLLAYPQMSAGAQAAAGLARRHRAASVRLLIDNPRHLAELATTLAATPTDRLTSVLDVDVGMGRTGVPASTWADALPELQQHDGLPPIRGLHGYEGHLSWEQGKAAASGYAALVELARRPGLDGLEFINTSGTHSYRFALRHDGLGTGPWTHQVSAGTVVLSDLRSAPAAQHLQLRQAAFVLSRVIATPGPGRLTLDAGSKALNPDCPPPGCRVVGFPDVEAFAPSEEHRPCRAPGLAPGFAERVMLVPEHVCTTVNLHRHAHYVRGRAYAGRGEVVAMSRSSQVTDFALGPG